MISSRSDAKTPLGSMPWLLFSSLTLVLSLGVLASTGSRGRQSARWLSESDGAKLGPVSATTIRPLDRADTEVLLQAVFAGDDPDPECYVFKQGPPQTVDAVDALVSQMVGSFEERTCDPYLMVDDDNHIVGLGWITEGDGEEAPEISFIVGPKFSGHGHATRAVDLLVRVAFDHGASSVEAVVNVNNQATVHIMEKLGFVVASAEHPIYHEVAWSRTTNGGG